MFQNIMTIQNLLSLPDEMENLDQFENEYVNANDFDDSEQIIK